MEADSSLQTESSVKNRIIINVGGYRHETHLNTLRNIPDTRLSWIVEHQNVFDSAGKKDYFFDRHPGAFTQVLNYFRTGKLHCPTDMCGPMFEEELTFWGIDEKQMEPCCWGKYTQHREAEENLRDFVGPGFESERLTDDNNMSMSISSLLPPLDKESCWQKLKPKVWLLLDKPHSSKLAKMVSYLSCFFISLSVATFCISTLPEMKAAGNFKAVGNNRALNKVETACSIFFTMEFIMRFLFCPSKFKFIQTPMDWLDFLAIIPFYVDLFVPNEIVKMFLVIRVFRLFRFIKLSYGLQIMIHTLKASSHELVLLLLILLIPVVLFSSIVYYIEVIMHNENSTFTSVPISLWWCLITMTTVGYGDMTPQTWPGKIMGGACAVCGVLIVALPISVIGSNFNLYYAHAQARLKLPMKQRHLVLGGVPGLITKHQELSSRRKKKLALLGDQHSEQDTSYAEQLPLTGANHEREPTNDDKPTYHDSADARAALIPLTQNDDHADSSAAIDPGLSRRRPRRTTATLLPMMQLQPDNENREEETPTHTSVGTAPQLICQTLDSRSTLSSPSPVLTPIGTPRNGSLDRTTSNDHLSANIARQSAQNPAQFHSEENVSNGLDVPSLRPSQSPSSGADDLSEDDELRSLLPRTGLWRRKSFSDSTLYCLPDQVKPPKNTAMLSERSEEVGKDVQPVINGTNGPPKFTDPKDPLENQTEEKWSLRKPPPPRGDKKSIIGNGDSPRQTKEGPAGSHRTTTHPPGNKSAVISIAPSTNGTEQDFLETNI